ncbi:hypothetical protein HN51_011764 [Arachis hypogaea]|uniref:Auxin-induced protein n=1 Tax=Arachis hypogaea TaxID=3818 RepID=A0A445DXN8_ARAHY|nr:auxin-responsive protein IAA27 [Arachis hypogaea]QHO57117.1 Auxin-responsive protein [Arachis hypogaea]RYR67943.1 hypothetical protein Ahy_A03g014416 [Arachis hypogaea]
MSAEKGYVGLGEVGEMEESIGLNLKATELRLGLPGSESPVKSTSLGAKRGFSDAIDGKWVLSGNGKAGSDLALGKDASLFSPPSDNTNNDPLPLPQPSKPIPAPAAKAQVVGWPPIRSFRKNSMATQPPQKNEADAEPKPGCLYVKVSMDGAPYLRKMDLNNYASYRDLSSALEKMFSCFTLGQCGSHGVSSRDNSSESKLRDLLHGSEYVLTYEDKDGDWMLVGDVPWEMFTDSCKRLRIMKSSEAIGLAPRAMEKCRSRN